MRRVTRNTRPAVGRAPNPTVHVIGAGVMGLTLAIELDALFKRLGVDWSIQVYEGAALGGGLDPRTAGPRCQLWLHTHGQLYATSQPAVSLALQKSTQRLQELAPDAFAFPLALAIELPSDKPPLSDFYDPLGVPHTPVPFAVFREWFPSLRLPPGSRVYRVTDAVIDLRLLSSALVRCVASSGIRQTPQRVTDLVYRNDRIRSLALANGDRVSVQPGDSVALACGAGVRPLLGRSGIVVPGLRLFQSHLVATEAFGLEALLAVARGGVNCVPHNEAGGALVNVFGSSYRVELPPDTDNQPLEIDSEAIDRIRSEVAGVFGLQLDPRELLAWAAVKTEIVPSGTRSQAHHARRVPGLTNAWLAIPGKLSQAPGCAHELACKIVRDRVAKTVARPVWETASAVPYPSKASRVA